MFWEKRCSMKEFLENYHPAIPTFTAIYGSFHADRSNTEVQSSIPISLRSIYEGGVFCFDNCSMIYVALQELICKEAEPQPEVDAYMIKRKFEKNGLDNEANADIRWSLPSCKILETEKKLLLTKAISIFHEDGLAKRACHGQDIISELPDVLRFHILTFLPRKYVIRIGAVLPRKYVIRIGAVSPKWKDLWKRRFPYLITLLFAQATQNAEDQREFANAIQNDMTVHGERKIETFNLYFYPGKEYEHMASEWIQQAMRNRVEEFLLDFSQGSVGAYPQKQISRHAKRFELERKTLQLQFCSNYFETKLLQTTTVL